MGRFRLFAVVAAAATVAGLVSAGSAAAAPAAAPTHPAHQRAAAPPTPVPDQPAIRWSRGANGKMTGRIYGGGLTSPVARVATGASTTAAITPSAARRAVEKLSAPPALTAADVPAVDQARVTGRVFDAALHPLAGVDVEIFAVDSDVPVTTASTNGNGHYSITLAAGDYFVGYDGRSATGGDADATGYIPTGESIHLDPEQHLIRNPRLKAGALVRVRATDTAGNPLAGVAPYLQSISAYAQSAAGGIFISFALDTSEVTASDGTLSLRGLSDDARLVCFSTIGLDPTGGAHDALGYAGRCSRRPIAPVAGSITDFPTIRLAAAPGGAVRGVVTALGHPVKDGFVIALGRQDANGIATADDGSYRITGLSPGKYQVCGASGAPGRAGLGFAPSCTRVTVRAGKLLTENSRPASRRGDQGRDHRSDRHSGGRRRCLRDRPERRQRRRHRRERELCGPRPAERRLSRVRRLARRVRRRHPVG